MFELILFFECRVKVYTIFTYPVILAEVVGRELKAAAYMSCCRESCIEGNCCSSAQYYSLDLAWAISYVNWFKCCEISYFAA